MTTVQKNKFKAAFMLMVFALNTVVAFACSVGLNMGYNSKHHQENSEEHITTPHHIHDSNTTTHKHNREVAKNEPDENNGAKDDCCNKNAVRIQQVDKYLSQAAKIEISIPVIILAVQSIYNIGPTQFANFSNNQFYFVRSDHPPIKDIRIAIQSFQI